MSLEEIVQTYNSVVKVMDQNAIDHKHRAYGGIVRATKGKLQEYITEEIIKIAWNKLRQDPSRLEINSKKIPIPIQSYYVENYPVPTVRAYMKENQEKYRYGLSVDKHVFIDGKFVLGIECKAYAENAMLKRILVDFHLLKTVASDISCCLFQLESQLGGDYSELTETPYGSQSTHSIMSYFPDVYLHIFTFLKGERNIEEPIHKYFKPLRKDILLRAIYLLEDLLRPYC